MTPCFNTGKVRIGCAYQKPRPRIEGDAVAIQGALLAARRTSEHKPTRSNQPLVRMLGDALAAFWRWC